LKSWLRSTLRATILGEKTGSSANKPECYRHYNVSLCPLKKALLEQGLSLRVLATWRRRARVYLQTGALLERESEGRAGAY
jgi:hypothetical protein